MPSHALATATDLAQWAVTRLTDGGTQEREAAAPYRETADRVANHWPRTARLLRRIADSFEREGEHWDIEASYTEDTWH